MTALDSYFQKLIERVDLEVSNQDKDENGFFKPTKSLLLKQLNILKDLHGKPLAKHMVKGAWQFVSENLPPEWLVLTPEEKTELKKILS